MNQLREKVALEDRSYEVIVHEGTPDYAIHSINEIFSSGPVVLITDENVSKYYLNAVEQKLIESGWEPRVIVVPPGEQSKSMETVSDVLTQVIEVGTDRTRPIIGLGGGVIGDLSGFVASVYLRGVPAIHIATSLLAMVDSSVGGKTGVNHHGTKNLVGTFHQPSLVFCSLGALKTLEQREIRSGLAEMAKAALLTSEQLIADMIQSSAALHAADTEQYLPLVHQCVSIKARIVEEDEREGGKRALLNLGHTFGHALEAASGLGVRSHGESIAIGIVAAAHVSVACGVADATLPDTVIKILKQLNLPYECDVPHGWKLALERDKKVRGNNINFICLQKISRPIIKQFDIEQVIFWIETRMCGYSSA